MYKEYRSKPGRQVNPDSLGNSGKQFHLLLQPTDLVKLFRIAKRKNISASQVVRNLIQNFKEE